MSILSFILSKHISNYSLVLEFSEKNYREVKENCVKERK